MCRMSMTIQCRVYSNLHEVFWCTLVQNGATIDARENQRVHLIILICANLPTHGRPRSISASLTTPYARLPGSWCSCVCFADCVFVCICGCCTNSMNCANACQCMPMHCLHIPRLLLGDHTSAQKCRLLLQASRSVTGMPLCFVLHHLPCEMNKLRWTRLNSPAMSSTSFNFYIANELAVWRSGGQQGSNYSRRG